MIKLYNGDCLEVMKQIPDNSIDMILCDLPYGTTRNKWDSAIDLEVLWEHYERVIKGNRAIVLFSQMPFTAELVHSNLKLFRYEWIWQKDNGTGFLNAKKMPLKIHENILIFYKTLPTYNPQMRYGFKAYVSKQGRHSTNYGAYVGRCVRIKFDERDITYDETGYYLEQTLYDEVGDAADSWEMSYEQAIELSEILAKDVIKYINEHNLQPNCYKLVDIEEVKAGEQE